MRFKYPVNEKLLEDIRLTANQDKMPGNGRFLAEVENLTVQKMTVKK